MNFKISRNADPQLIARLNHDVQKLHHEIEPDIFKPFSFERMTKLFTQSLNDPSISAYVAFVDETPAAYILLSEKYVEENDFKYGYAVLHIDQICVDSPYKGQGIGKRLVDFAKQFAKDNNIKRLEMNYWTKNQNSGDFFRSQGFINYNERLFIDID